MNGDDQRQVQEAAKEREESVPAQSFFAPYAPEGRWENILTLLEISPDALVLIDSDGRIMNVNSQAEELFGYVGSELKGEALEILLPERFHTAHMHHRERYASTPRTRPMGTGLELYGRRKDGTEFAVDVSLSPLLFDGALYMLGAVRDITMRQQMKEYERVARETAQGRLALLQLVLDELPTCVYFVAGSEARLVLANQAAATLWGATWPAGQPMLDFLSTHHIRVYDMNEQVVEPTSLATMRVLQEGQTVFQHQEIIRHADGTSLPILVNAVVVDPNMLAGLEADRENIRISSTEPAALVVLHDVTSLKEAEHLKDQLIWLVAHELRNPLAALKGFATMLLRHSHGNKGTPLVTWQKEAFAEIDLATDRLNRLTEDLLDVVRLQTGKLVLQREPVDLVDVMRHVVAQMEQSSEQHKLTFSTSLLHLQAQVDRGRIEQVLVNLLTNAIKYSPDGGLIEMSLQQVPGQQEALITIRDQGIGIPQAEQAQLFGRFSRASNGESQGISGTGLGLYLCHELVSQHGGDIWFESTEGVGSTFFLRLPLLQN
ncbi:MAG: ATP-binding protein [Chloroflexota bacterium]|nr:ATP-binding protein [Chloroflexota bacterium]